MNTAYKRTRTRITEAVNFNQLNQQTTQTVKTINSLSKGEKQIAWKTFAAKIKENRIEMLAELICFCVISIRNMQNRRE